MTVRIRTAQLELVAKSKADVQAMIDAMTPYEKAQMSAEWLSHFAKSSSPDPWIHGFTAMRRDDSAAVGTGGFAAPPAGGVVEIAYTVGEQFRGKNYATEIGHALVAWVFAASDVEIVRAHTLPDGRASQRVLEKCGFERVGDIDHPDDGLVWRFEKYRRTFDGPGHGVDIVSLD